jgi:hypothetical protein
LIDEDQHKEYHYVRTINQKENGRDYIILEGCGFEACDTVKYTPDLQKVLQNIYKRNYTAQIVSGFILPAINKVRKDMRQPDIDDTTIDRIIELAAGNNRS